MPLTVLLDAHGGDLYQSGPQAYLQRLPCYETYSDPSACSDKKRDTC